MKTRMTALVALAACVAGATAAWADKPDPVETFYVTNEFVGDCGGFSVLSDYRVDGSLRFFYKKDGSFDRALIWLDFSESVYFNSEDPSYWLPGTAEHVTRWAYFKDGQELYDVDAGAPFRVILPGYGPVFMGVGRVVYDITTGQATFMGGKWDYYVGDFEAICAALRP